MSNVNVNTKTVVRFSGWDCSVNVSNTYSLNRRQQVIQLTVADTGFNRAEHEDVFPGEPFATASLCIPGYPFGYKETAIKDYSENRGILDALVTAGVIEKTGLDALVNLMPVPVVRILI